jgi:nucleotide-binding universal stress UspA family protein
MNRGVGTILVATDLSSITGTLFATAAQVGGGDRAITALYVYTPEDYAEIRRETGIPVDQYIANLKAEIRFLLEQAGLPPMTVRMEVVEGWSIPEQVLAAADRLNAALIIMGTHGRTGLRRALMGSVAEAVLRHSHRPVLVVPQAVIEVAPARESAVA